MNIVLIGYRGSGKTTVGRRLAERLGYTHVDTDELVRERFGGMTIRQIWHEHGEEKFRDAEARVVADVLREDDRVIALGGGAAVQSAGHEAVAEASDALRVYLACDAAALHQRITSDTSRADRPSTGGPANELESIREQLARREPAYRAAADCVIDATDLTPDQIVNRIIDEHRRHVN